MSNLNRCITSNEAKAVIKSLSKKKPSKKKILDSLKNSNRPLKKNQTKCSS
jgi:hypothetical protein